MKVKLNVLDRLVFAALYPQQANLVDQITVRGIKAKVDISPEESIAISLKANDTAITWDKSKAKVIEVDLALPEIVLLKDSIDRLDREKKIGADMVDLCLKIKELK